MGNKANPLLIGAFITGAISLMVIAVLLFASGTFAATQKSIIYFDGSVSGLNIGALVKLKGVAIGKVTDIIVMFDEANGKIVTPVVIEFQPNKIFDTQGQHRYSTSAADIKRLVDHGLRAQLQMQSLLTGQLFVDIHFRPASPVKLLGGAEPIYPEIPSIPSPKEQLENTAEEVMTTVRQLPIQQTAAALLASLQQVETLLKSPQIPAALTHLDQSLQDLHQLLAKLDSKVDPISGHLTASLQQSQALMATLNRNSGPLLQTAQDTLLATRSTMEQAKATLASVEQTTGQNASLDLAMRDLASAAKSLRILADYLERHPDAVLYGKQPDGE